MNDAAITLFRKLFVNGKSYQPYSCSIVDAVEGDDKIKLQFANGELIDIKDFIRANKIHVNFGYED